MTALSCGEARRLACDDRDAGVVSVERARAEAHIARCPACQRFVATMRLLARVVGEARSGETAPLTLRLRIRDAIAEGHRQHARRRTWGRLGLGLAATLALFALGLPLLRRGEGDPVARIARQEATLLAAPGIESSDAQAVHAWLAQRLPFGIHVPEFLDARLTGAAIAALDGGKGAVLRFRIGDRHIVYVVAPEESEADSTLRPGRAGDLTIVSWRMPGLLHVWLGQIPVEQLSSLARRCAEQARTAASISGLPLFFAAAKT